MKLLLCSDVHANPYPLRKVLESEKWDMSIFMGDIVDYGPLPSETIDLVKENFDLLVQGNHDSAAGLGIDCHCGQENHELSVYTRDNVTIPRISREDRNYLASLPQNFQKEVDNMKIFVSHGSPANNLYGYMYPWTISPDSMKNALGRLEDATTFIVGHTHYQFSLHFNGKIIINPGSVGQPRDSIPDPSYTILDTESTTITHRRVKYDSGRLKEEIMQSIDDKKMLERNLRLFRLA